MGPKTRRPSRASLAMAGLEIPGEPVAHDHGLLSIDFGLPCGLGYLAFQVHAFSTSYEYADLQEAVVRWTMEVADLRQFQECSVLQIFQHQHIFQRLRVAADYTWASIAITISQL